MTRPAFSDRPWWSRVYAQLLRAFPREFRDRWGPDMRLAFADRVRDAREISGRTPWKLIARELWILAGAGLEERLHSNTPLPHMLHAQDIRYAFRLLARSPGFSLLTVLVLAGGLGLSTFTFSFLYTGMMRPLPLSEGDRIVRLTRIQDGLRRTQVDVVDVRMLRESMRTVHELGAYTKREVIVGREGDRRVLTTTVTDPTLFKVARTPALMGRALVPSDAEPGAEPVMVLSYRSWNVAFAGERDVVNAHVTVNGVSTRVVGVMPEGFGFPVAQDAWTPLPATMGASALAGSEYLSMFGRLAPGATQAQAAAEATSLLQAALVARDTSEQAAARMGMVVESFPAAQIGEERTLAFASMNVLAALILLLSLVNAATLLSARANERVRETAVRLALGASRGRLVMQGMWEGIILCLIAGIIGTAAVAWGLDAITSWTQAKMPDNLAFWWVWRMDLVTLLAAGAFVTVAIAVLGSVVSVRAIRTNVREVMQDSGARGGSRREGRLTRVLVAMQVTAVTVLMFVGVLSGVMARRVVTIDPGYDPTNLLQTALIPAPHRYPTVDARHEVYRLVQTGLAEHRALDRVMVRNQLAEQRTERGRFATLEASATSVLPTAHIVAASGAMSALGIDLVEGREFTLSDDRTRAPVALISQSLAAGHWRGRSPVGAQVRLAGVGDTLQWRTIVGVVGDIPYGDPLSRDRTPDAIYVPVLQVDVPFVNVIVHHSATELAGRQALHEVFGAVDPLLVPGYVFRAQEVIDQVGLITTGMTKLFGSCFVFALLLAVAGTYGLMSRSIGLRTREIGVRRALGASDAMATRMLLAQGARQLGVGTLVAAPILVVVGAASTHFLPLGAMLTATAGVLVSASIIAVVLAATWLPTRKVLRVPLRDALWKE
jgi:putative ABC transport system permease protein